MSTFFSSADFSPHYCCFCSCVVLFLGSRYFRGVGDLYQGDHNPIPALRAWRNLSYQRTGAGSQTLHCWPTSVSPHFRHAFFPQWHRLFVGVLCMGLMGVWCSVSKMDLTVNTDVYCTAELPRHEGKEQINCHCCWNSLTTCPSSTHTAAHVTYLVVPLAQITLSLILFLLNFLEHLSIPEHMD